MYSIVPLLLLDDHFSLMNSFLLILIFFIKIAHFECWTNDCDNNNDENDEVAFEFA